MILWLWYSQSHLRTPHTIDSNFSLFINCQQWQHLQFVWLFFISLVLFIFVCGWFFKLLYQPYWPMLSRTQKHMWWQQTNALWTAQVLSKTTWLWWQKTTFNIRYSEILGNADIKRYFIYILQFWVYKNGNHKNEVSFEQLSCSKTPLILFLRINQT